MKSRKNQKKKVGKGFTLVELIITMTIVVVLSLISWPIYRSFHLKEVSMLAEGYALLGSIKDAQIHYYNEYGNFLCARESFAQNQDYPNNTYTSSDPVLGINVMNNRYFSKFNYDSGNRTQFYWKNRFSARAHGKIGKNATDTVEMILPFNLTERGELTILGNGTTTIETWNH